VEACSTRLWHHPFSLLIAHEPWLLLPVCSGPSMLSCTRQLTPADTLPPATPSPTHLPATHHPATGLAHPAPPLSRPTPSCPSSHQVFHPPQLKLCKLQLLVHLRHKMQVVQVCSTQEGAQRDRRGCLWVLAAMRAGVRRQMQHPAMAGPAASTAPGFGLLVLRQSWLSLLPVAAPVMLRYSCLASDSLQYSRRIMA